MLITRLWRHQKGDYFFLSTKSRGGTWRDHPFKRSQFSKVPQFIKDNRDKDIYWCPSGFTKPRRVMPYVVMPSLLTADLDEADPRKIAIRPTIAIESSPGRFVGVWVVDKPITDEINRRLTYFIDADKSGWDCTQVLRIPGTVNYKYESLPKVRTLWIDGPSYKLADIIKKLPDEEEKASGGTESKLASEIFKEHEDAIPQWARRELLNGKPTVGNRSEMIWKLQNTMIEIGLTREESFVLIKASPWNKFSGRRGEDEQLRRELDKIINKHFKGKKGETYKFLAKSMEEVEEEKLDWLWYPYLAKGEVSILEGDPGLGKSYLAQMVAGAIVDGKRLPSVKKMPVASGPVASFDLENSAGTVTKKRMVENGVKNLSRFYQEEQPFTIDDAEKMLQVHDAIERLRPLLVVFDTINTYLGKADAYKAAETQQAMGNFKEIAKRYNCAVLVLRHLTKGAKDKALYRGQGSIAFSGFARVVITVGSDPQDPETRVVAVTKLNVAKHPRSLTFTIDELPDTIKAQDRSRFRWGDFSDLTSDDILGAPEKNNDKDAAAEWLKDQLSKGPMPVKKLETMAEKRNISLRTLQRAADVLGVEREVHGFGKNKRSEWNLS